MDMHNSNPANRTGPEQPASPKPRWVSKVEPPAMVVYHQGWFSNRMTERSANDLANEDREQRKRAAGRV